MAEDANARIRVDIDTAAALANIKNLQRQISAFHTSLAKSGAAASAASMQMQQSLLNSINKTGQFSATIKNVKTTTDSFTSSLEKNKLSMGEYFRYAGASTKTFGRLFRTEFDTINKVARERVKDLQTQYIKMGRDANGAMRAIAVRPLALDMENLSTRTQIAAQRQALLNQLLKQGSTNLLNFGKNTQWAGRQLMVGFTVPLVMLGSVAAKTFMDMEKQAVRFKRVYGEMFTTTEETNKAVKEIQNLANEFTKYGIAAAKTMELAADIAATGKMGAELNAQVAETTRLAILGGVEQAEALQATISLTDAFGVSAEELAGKIDFLNAVENQTITSIEDLTIAIPKAGPVVQQLGGDVEDLTFFLTAMREGGINASEGANALKSGLAALINPTGRASEMLAEFGINIKGIVEANAGDVKGLVLDFASALDTLDPLNRARAIEQLFGKFQFSRLSTLFANVIKDGNQASRVLKLANATTEELAVLSARELKKIEDSPMFKFQKALEDIKVTLIPLGEAFLKAVTPILEFGTKILKKFDELDDGAKNFVVGLTAIAGVIGPVFLMGFGLIANGVANVIKGFVFFKTAMNRAGTASTQLGMQTEYMTQQQLEASAVAASLDQVHQKLRQTFTSEAIAVNGLTAAYQKAIAAQLGMTGGAISRTRPPKGAAPAVGYASGVLSVPGPKGAGDVVPAMLSPGEAVIPARQAQKYSGFISSMIADNVPGFRFGRNPFAKFKSAVKPEGSKYGVAEGLLRLMTGNRLGPHGSEPNFWQDSIANRFIRSNPKIAVRMQDKDLLSLIGSKDKRYKSVFETKRSNAGDTEKDRAYAEEKLFGLPQDVDPSKRPTYGYMFKEERGQRFIGRKQSLFNRLTGKKDRSLTRSAYQGVFNSRDASLMNPKTFRYGNAAMILKNRNIKDRTTFTYGDSYNRSLDRFGTPARLGTRNKDDIKASYTSQDKDFFEAQIMGGFTLKDVKKIVVTEPQLIPALQEALRQQGLKIPVGMPKFTMLQRLRSVVSDARLYGTTLNPQGNRINHRYENNELPVTQKDGSYGIKEERYIRRTTLNNPPTELNLAARLFQKLGVPGYKKGIAEVKKDSAIVSFGAHQPFTIAHQDIAKLGMARAAAENSEFLQFTTNQGKSKRSVIDDKLKTKLIAEALGINPKFAKNPFDLMRILSERGIKNVELLLGEDRMSSKVWAQAAKEYGINLKQTGIPRREGSPSGTAARAAAAANDKNRFNQLIAAGVSPKTRNQVFQTLLSSLSKNKFASGVLSVPGPKGAGDVVPAMLAPGEAVIPAKQAEKYRGLIQSMVSGKIPGYEEGYSSLTFDQRSTVSSGHMVSGVQGLTRSEAIARARIDHDEAIRSGLYQRLGKNPDLIWKQFNDNINKFGPDNVSLFSNVVEPITKRFNAATANKDSRGLTAQEYLRELRRTPKGTFGSGILARLPRNHGIDDTVLSRYANDIQKSFTSQLKAEAALDRGKPAAERRRISEAQTSRMYATAVDRALSRIKDPRALQMITDSNAAARMLLTPGTPGAAGSGSGRTDKPVKALFGNVREKTQNLFRGRGSFAGVMDKLFQNFAAKRNRNFLPQSSISVPTATQVEASSLLNRLNPARRFRVEQELINAQKLNKEDRPAAFRSILDDPRNSPDARLAAGIDKAADSKSPSKKLVDASAKNLVDGTVKGIEDGKQDVTKAGKSMATAFVDGTERVRVTEKGQFYDRNTNKRISEAAARKTMALDKQNERSRERAAARRELSNKRAAGISQTYGMTAKQYDALSPEQLRELKAQKGLADSKARAAVVAAGEAKKVERERVANAAVAAQQKEQRNAARKERFAAIGNKVASGASMAGMGAMMYGMTGGPGAEIAMMASMPLMMAPMLGKLAPVVIGLTAVAAAAFALKGVFDQAQTSTMKLAESLGTGDEAVRSFAEFAGTASAGEVMDKRRENALQPFAIQTGKSTFGQSFIQSEQGQAMAASTRESISKLGRSGTETQLVTQLVNAVSSGALDAGQARSIVSNIAKEIGDASFGLNVNAKLVELLGVNGENLLEDPLTIRIKLAEDSEKQIGVVAQKLQELPNPFEELSLAALTTGTMMTAGSIAGGAIGTAIAPGPGTAIGVAVGRISGTVAGLALTVPKVVTAFANMGTASAAVVASSKMALQQQQQLLDSLDLDYEKRIAIAEAAGDLEKAERLTNQYMLDRAALLEQGKETRAAIATSFEAADFSGKMALQEAAKKSIENKYKDDPDGMALAMGARQQVIDASGLNETQEYMLTVGLASDLDPLVISELMSVFGSNEDMMTQTFTLMDNLGNADTNRTLNVMKMFRDENGEPLLDQQTKFVADITAKSDVPEEARKYLEMFESVSRVLDAEIVLKFLNEDEDAAAKMLEMKEIIDSVDGKMGMDIVTDLVGEENMDNFKEYEQYFNGLPDNFQKTFMTQFVTTMLLQGNEAMMDQYEAWLNEPGNKDKEFADFALDSGFITTETNKDNTVEPMSDEESSGGGGGPSASSLDDVLKKLRDIRKNQIAVTKGFEASADAINKLFGGGAGINLFSGIENDMRRLGAEEDLISLVAGMSPEDFEKQKNTLFNFDKQTGEILGFKDQLQNIGKALAAVALGQYVSDQQKSAKESRNQALAFNQLRAAGYSVAEAYETVQDAAVASAVATGNVTRDQLNTMLAELRNAQAAMREAARLTPEGLQEVFEDGFNRAMEAFDTQEKKLTLEYEFKIADDQKLIDDAQDQIDAIRYQLDDYEADLRGIEDQENAINETYDKKLDALEKVRKANQKVIDQERGRLSVAEAITRGDLAATARAIQDVRQTSASGYFSSQTDALNAARQSAIDAARGKNGLSRIEIEERIEQLTKQIFEIEENSLEPAAERVRLAQIELESRIAEQEVLGKTRAEWENIKNGIDLARVGSVGYKEDMEEALAIVQDVKDAWAGIQSKAVTLTVQTINDGDVPASTLGSGTLGNGAILTNTPIPKTDTELSAARNAALAAAQSRLTELRRDRARADVAGQESRFPAIDAQIREAQAAIDRIMGKPVPTRTPPPLAPRVASGGYISGPGTATSDSIPAMLSNGEYVIKAAAVNKFGKGFLDAINAGRLPGFKMGGAIGGGSSKSTPAKPPVRMTADAAERRALAAQPSLVQRIVDMAVKSVPLLQSAKEGIDITKSLINVGQGKGTSTDAMVLGLGALNFIPGGKAVSTGAKAAKQANSIIPKIQKLFSSDPNTLQPRQFSQALSNPAIVTRRSQSSVESMLRENNVKTLFDTGTSGGSTSQAMRANLEQSLFGKDNIEKISYGILANKKGLTRSLPFFRTRDMFDPFQTSILQYGDTLLNLKRSAFKKTSLTAGDSLNNFERGLGASDNFLTQSLALANKKAVTSKFEAHPMQQYVEAQIRGLNPRTDIKNIWASDAKSAKELSAVVKELGLKIPVKVSPSSAQRETQTVLGNVLGGLKNSMLNPKTAKTRLDLFKKQNFDLRKYNPFTNKLGKETEMRMNTLAQGGMVSKYAGGGKVGYYPMGGLIPYKAEGGMFKTVNTDSVPAMLTPGEFVVKRKAVQQFGEGNLEKINSGLVSAGSFSGGPSVQSFSSPSFNTQVSPVSINQGAITSNQFTPVSSNSVYNYSLSVNVASQSDPNVIAQTVMGQIRNIDSQRIRSNRF